MRRREDRDWPREGHQLQVRREGGREGGRESNLVLSGFVFILVLSSPVSLIFLLHTHSLTRSYFISPYHYHSSLRPWKKMTSTPSTPPSLPPSLPPHTLPLPLSFSLPLPQLSKTVEENDIHPFNRYLPPSSYSSSSSSFPEGGREGEWGDLLVVEVPMEEGGEEGGMVWPRTMLMERIKRHQVGREGGREGGKEGR